MKLKMSFGICYAIWRFRSENRLGLSYSYWGLHGAVKPVNPLGTKCQVPASSVTMAYQ